MTRYSAKTQHGHLVSSVAVGCPVTLVSERVLSAHAVDAAQVSASSRPSTLAYPTQTQIIEPRTQFAGLWNLFGKPEQRQAIT